MAKRKKNSFEDEHLTRGPVASPSRKTITDRFRRHYRETRDWQDAWNRTLELAGGRSIEADELATRADHDAYLARRREIANHLKVVMETVLREEGDPFTLAVDAATNALVEQGALQVLDEAYSAATEGLAQDDLDDMEGPILYVEFTDDGRLDGWVVDHPSYYRGWGGPVAAVLAGATAHELRDEIEEALAQADALSGGTSFAPNPNGYGDYADRQGLTMKCSQLDTRPGAFDFGPGASHWDCRLKRGKKSMKVIFSMGSALAGPPSVDDVVHSLAMDAGTWEQLQDAAELAAEFGYEDEREAARVWKAMESQTGRLQRFLDDPERYNELLYHVQENPIGNPMSPRMKSALAAGIGSLGGLILGGAIGGGLVAWMGSIAGGAAGGYLGSRDAVKGGGAIGGGLGGTLYPLGAGLGAYLGTYEENPERLVVTARSQDEAERKARKFGRIVGVTRAAPGKYHVVVARRHNNPVNTSRLSVRRGRR